MVYAARLIWTWRIQLSSQIFQIRPHLRVIDCSSRKTATLISLITYLNFDFKQRQNYKSVCIQFLAAVSSKIDYVQFYARLQFENEYIISLKPF